MKEIYLNREIFEAKYDKIPVEGTFQVEGGCELTIFVEQIPLEVTWRPNGPYQASKYLFVIS